MVRNPLTHDETVTVFNDFKRYVETEGATLERIKSTQFKKLYNDRYKTYHRQVYPQEKVPTFFAFISAIYEANLGYFQGGKFCIGNQRNRKKKPSSSQSTTRIDNRDGATPHTTRSRMAVDQHLTFKTKAQKLGAKSTAPVPVDSYVIQKSHNQYFCPLCAVTCSSQKDINEHLLGRKHKQKAAITTLKGYRGKLVEGAHGVQINSDMKEDAGTFCIDVKEKEKKSAELRITNTGLQSVQLKQCHLLKDTGVFTLQDAHNITTSGRATVNIEPEQSYKIQVSCCSGVIGTFHCPVMFHLISSGSNGTTSFHMMRYLLASVVDDIVLQTQPTSEYKHPPRSTRTEGKPVHCELGWKLPKNTSDQLERIVELKPCQVPSKLRKMFNRGLLSNDGLSDEEAEEMQQLRLILESDLDMEIYHQRFDALLHMEEVQMEVDILKYNMEGATMTRKKNSNLLLLTVPGLAEGRPSVLRGDSLYVRVLNADKKLGEKEYEGCVHEVQLNQVGLGFSRGFRDMFVDNMKFHVRFKFNRLPIKLQHRSCLMASQKDLKSILFPTSYDMLDWVAPSDQLRFYDRELEDNAEQRNAVEHIVAGTSMPAPYLVFGPPGTGKTVTIVEAMKQVWKKSPNNMILACAPSNSAADLITVRLLKHIPKTDIIRLNASSRSWSSIQDQVKEVSSYDRNTDSFQFPKKEVLSKYRFVITTIVTAGRLVTADFPAGHFSHIFIDEAGHAVEPECIIAIAGLMANNVKGQVVLAGDPRQLGPVLRSPLAIKYKLGISLLERLMVSCELYKPTDTVSNHKAYNNHVITKLLKNYRSHPKILELPNEMFYDSELIPSADKLKIERFCQWEELPKKGFPVMFHSVMGRDMREEKSPSFFNPEEVSEVVKYVEKLLSPGAKRSLGVLKQSDIGVITPYRKQVEKIRKMLSKTYKDVTVGSVEEFQGQERTVLIVSTVRSKPEYLSLDLSFKLGFLRNPKRFNVTVTRAKALLIVIGNPAILSFDYHWKRLIDFCKKNGGFTGQPWATEEEELDKLVERLQNLQLVDDEYQLIQSLYNDQSWKNNDDDELVYQRAAYTEQPLGPVS